MSYIGIEEDIRLIKVVPSERQLTYEKMEFFCFIHFTVNTFTGSEWGDGKEDVSIFNPTELDARQWVKTAKDAGMKGLILTCKHHDGFCLWPSKYTEHSVKNSPYKNGNGDIVREVSEACKEFGLKFGVYLSPWDRNNSSYGKGKKYDDYYVNQLTELLTEYGELYTIWLDGACGEGANGKVQKYDWNRYYKVMRELQPNAVISISGPDVRWCGNEAGEVRESEWSVVAKDMTDPSITAELSQHEDNEEFRDRPLDETQSDLGSRERLKNEKELVWYPAETDVSIRPGWFYHEEEDDKVRSFENLKDIYLKSVGGNTTLLLNIPPMKNGIIHEKDIAILKRLGEFINDTFKDNLLKNALITTVPEHDCRGNSPDMMRTDDYNTYFMNKEGENKLLIEIKFDECKKLNYLVLKEAITFSQRVEKFNVYFNDESGNKIKIFEGTTIGYKRIIDLKGTKTDNLTIEIEDSRVAPVMSFVGVY
ncbi:alpha-L-fucosidase [Lachnoanaerobaculum sp. JCM 36186]|uniref:alpha-L-fucosidase n=1 Tax=Lachnoanaerobaculum sanguinis TaxID=3065809 RepID=UPI00275B0EB9|nr:alpha-L-fucosidase [Lachnoanaerobaculum sp. JCM 36186]GMO04049.1 alpha-L-fucosidase [Lachnoanaerobaculum sp. JCM 36186]